jgi:hypothetical protein
LIALLIVTTWPALSCAVIVTVHGDAPVTRATLLKRPVVAF